MKNEIIEVLKKEGLPATEDAVVIAVKVAFRILGIVIPKVSSGLGKIVFPLILYAEPLVLEQVDKIDGVDSPDY